MAKVQVLNSKPTAMSEIPLKKTITEDDFVASILLSANPESEKERERGIWSSFGIWGFEFET